MYNLVVLLKRRSTNISLCIQILFGFFFNSSNIFNCQSKPFISPTKELSMIKISIYVCNMSIFVSFFLPVECSKQVLNRLGNERLGFALNTKPFEFNVYKLITSHDRFTVLLPLGIG